MALASNKRCLPESLSGHGSPSLSNRDCCISKGIQALRYADSDETEQFRNRRFQRRHNRSESQISYSIQLRPQHSSKVSNVDFKRLVMLGVGSFAKVFLVKSLFDSGVDNNLFAMKVLDKRLVLEKNQMSHTMTERNVLGRCGRSHPFIVSLKYAFQTVSTLNLVLDFCSGGELFYHLSRVGRFSESRARFYVAELTLALEFLHQTNVVYRDLKPENVLIASDGHIKLADFGLAKEEICCSISGADTFCGTPAYLAPEVIFRKGHGKGVDWWCLGVLLYEMLYRLPPWYSKNRREMFQGICQGELSFPDQPVVSSPCKSFIRGLLTKDVKRRLGSKGAVGVKSHRYFHGIDFKDVLHKTLPVPWKPETGKIYFDDAVTKLPCDMPAVNDSVVTSGPNEQSHTPYITTSPSHQMPDHAFTGFSFTDPMYLRLDSKSLDSEKSCTTHQIYAQIEVEEYDEVLESSDDASLQDIALVTEIDDVFDDGSQFDLELEF